MNSDAWSFGPPAFSRVSVRGVSRAFGRTHALYRCNLTVETGSVLAVVGPNGAGKTTLLQLLATLDRPTEGEILFDERHDSVKRRHAIRPYIGLVAHDSLLYAELSGLENLRFTARLHGRDPELAATWIARVGLEHASDAPVASYSRGMRQRLSIARALLPEPTLVLFDEPLTGLDRAARAFLYDTIATLRKAGRAVVAVTHHLDWPIELLDRALVLEGGRVRYDGPLEESLAEIYGREVGR
jgi:ABC-type multidrug transport system ATPase subunit